MLCKYTKVSHREETHTIALNVTDTKAELFNQVLA